MSAIEFRTLGTLDLRAADGRELYSLLAQSKRIALLAYLCIAVAPDDRLLTVHYLDPYATDKIVVVQNWFEELKSKLH